MNVTPRNTEIQTLQAQITYNDVLNDFTVDSNYIRHLAIPDLELPASSSILRIRLDLENSFNLSAGGQNRTKVKIYEGSDTLIIQDTTHERRRVYQRNLYKEPFFAGSSTRDIVVEIESFLQGVWSIHGTLPHEQSFGAGFGANPDAGNVVGGELYNGALTNRMHQYSGGTWDLEAYYINYVSRSTASGTSSSALNVGGDGFSNSGIHSGEWNGVCWASGGNMSVSRRKPGGLGDASAFLVVGGDATFNLGSNSSTGFSTCEKYNGSAWSLTTNNYPVAVLGPVVFGSITSNEKALCCNGRISVNYNTALIFVWDQITWASHSICNVERANGGGAGSYNSGNSDVDGIIYGGWTGSLENSVLDVTEIYSSDTGTWVVGGPLLSATSGMGYCGNEASAMSASGSNYFFTVEEFTDGGGTPANLNTLTNGSMNIILDYIIY